MHESVKVGNIVATHVSRRTWRLSDATTGETIYHGLFASRERVIQAVERAKASRVNPLLLDALNQAL